MPELELIESAPEVIEDLRQKLTDPTSSLPEKYRVLFSLRNVKGPLAHQALLQGNAAGTVCVASQAPLKYWQGKR